MLQQWWIPKCYVYFLEKKHKKKMKNKKKTMNSLDEVFYHLPVHDLFLHKDCDALESKNPEVGFGILCRHKNILNKLKQHETTNRF